MPEQAVHQRGIISIRPKILIFICLKNLYATIHNTREHSQLLEEGKATFLYPKMSRLLPNSDDGSADVRQQSVHNRQTAVMNSEGVASVPVNTCLTDTDRSGTASGSWDFLVRLDQ